MFLWGFNLIGCCRFFSSGGKGIFSAVVSWGWAITLLRSGSNRYLGTLSKEARESAGQSPLAELQFSLDNLLFQET